MYDAKEICDNIVKNTNKDLRTYYDIKERYIGISDDIEKINDYNNVTIYFFNKS